MAADEPTIAQRLKRPRWLIPPALLALGIVLVLLPSETLGFVGIGVIGIAITVTVSLVFLEVGESEDRARERGEYGPPKP
jgi:hypothetical protein